MSESNTTQLFKQIHDCYCWLNWHVNLDLILTSMPGILFINVVQL